MTKKSRIKSNQSTSHPNAQPGLVFCLQNGLRRKHPCRYLAVVADVVLPHVNAFLDAALCTTAAFANTLPSSRPTSQYATMCEQKHECPRAWRWGGRRQQNYVNNRHNSHNNPSDSWILVHESTRSCTPRDIQSVYGTVRNNHFWTPLTGRWLRWVY